MTRPRVVIGGGTGFLGRRLAAVLGGGGFDVAVLSRAPARPPIGPVRFLKWRGLPASGDESWPAALEGARAVVNLCGESIGGPRWTAARKRLLVESRTLPTEALVTAVNDASEPPHCFVQASGVGYYGTGDETRTESSPPGNDFLAQLTRQWEAPLANLREDTRSVTARFGVVLGASGGALHQMLLPFKLFVGGPIASGRQWLSWIHLHDAGAAVAWLIDRNDARGAFNVTAPNPVRNAEFAEAVGAALHRPTWMFTPRVMLKVLLGEQATLVCDGQRVLPERLEAVGFTFGRPTISSALEDLI
jgi:uncharacterized protein (TIGR01777 family)